MFGSKVQSVLSASRSLVSHSTRNQSTKTVTLIPGDGIGPEIAASVQKYVKFIQVHFTWRPDSTVSHSAVPDTDWFNPNYHVMFSDLPCDC